jgi:hypothetical protein
MRLPYRRFAMRRAKPYPRGHRPQDFNADKKNKAPAGHDKQLPAAVNRVVALSPAATEGVSAFDADVAAQARCC